MSNASPMAIVDIFVAPSNVFNQVKDNKKWAWLGLLLIIAISALSSVLFFGSMSPEWIVEQQLAQSGDLSAQEAEQAKGAMMQMAQYTGVLGAVFGGIFIIIMTCLFAAYNMLIGKSAGVIKPDFKYADWFSFTLWTSMPAIVNTIGFMVLFLTASTSDLPLSMANYASVNQLFFNYLPSDSLYTWAESLNLFSLWSIFLTTVGFQRCCNMSLANSTAAAVLPYFVIFASWFALA